MTMHFPIEHLTGVVLAGGRSSRFGSDKAFATYNGERFIHRILKIMEGIFQEIIIVTNYPEKYRDCNIANGGRSPSGGSDQTSINQMGDRGRAVSPSIIKDEIPFQGPAGGIVTALKWTKAEGVFAVACDMPLLSRETILHLLEKDDGSPVVLYRHQNGIEPLCAVYRPSVLPVLESRLRAGRRDLHSLVQESHLMIQEIPFTGFPDSFRNVNTPQDLKTLISPFNQQRPSNSPDGIEMDISNQG